MKFTLAPLTNPVPFTVKVNAAEPALVLEGCSDAKTGTGFVVTLVTVNVSAFEVPPPGVGFVTVTDGVPAAATAVAGTAAVS